MLTVGLFISLFASLYLLLVPTGAYNTSPAGITIDKTRRFIELKLTEGDKGSRLMAVNRSTNDVIKTGLLIGLGLGLLTLLIGPHFIGIFAVPLAIAVTLIGIFMADYAIQNEFKAWQARLFAGVPVMVNFIPAFLEVRSITPREALSLTLPFVPEPLKSEVWAVLDKLKRTGNADQAFDLLANRAKHPAVEAISFRLAAAWKSRIEPDVFDDLGDEIDSMREMAATRATTMKGGMFAMVSVFGLLGGLLVYGYPGFQYMIRQMGGGFGF